MDIKVLPSSISGRVRIPGSKSHTIRGVFFASMAKGKSILRNPLVSTDSLSCVRTLKQFGADIEMFEDKFIIEGFDAKPKMPDNIVDVGNSGTTLRILLSLATLIEGRCVLTGDEQIVKRPLKQLIDSLKELKANITSVKDNGCAPVIVEGGLFGTKTSVEAITSQFLSSLLMTLPFYNEDVEILVPLLNEKPYVDLTLWWLEKLGINYSNEGYDFFKTFGKQHINEFDMSIPGDFSSATFFAVLAACQLEGSVVLTNLDLSDPQGDKRVIEILEEMGAEVERKENEIRITPNELVGKEIDMNDIPDALPAMAVLGCIAKGETILYNVAQARLKETDRIAVMCSELKKMGADICEREDGLVIRESELTGACVLGHHDHRVIMSLCVAGMLAKNETIIKGKEAIDVTFPDFIEKMTSLGARIEEIEV